MITTDIIKAVGYIQEVHEPVTPDELLLPSDSPQLTALFDAPRKALCLRIHGELLRSLQCESACKQPSMQLKALES